MSEFKEKQWLSVDDVAEQLGATGLKYDTPAIQ